MSSVTYFQKYSTKENSTTNNTLFLLSIVYRTSPEVFYAWVSILEDDLSEGKELRVTFGEQERSRKSVPDGFISQSSFKIVVETKLSDWFYDDQLQRHSMAFGNEDHKILLALSPEKMTPDEESRVGSKISAAGGDIVFVNYSFEELIDDLRDSISAKAGVNEVSLKELVDNYEDYCGSEHLLVHKEMWVVPTGVTWRENERSGVYYRSVAQASKRSPAFLGLYNDKKVNFVGKVLKVVEYDPKNPGDHFRLVSGQRMEDADKDKIFGMMDLASTRKENSWDLKAGGNWFFIVDKFFPTDYRKGTAGGLFGTRYIDLTDLNEAEPAPGKMDLESAESVAVFLKGKVWGM